MSQLVFPFTFADGTIAEASEVNANNAAIQAVINGGLDNGNIADGADIETAKIKQDAGLQTGHYGPKSVTAAKLADGAITTITILDESITTGKIADGAVTLAKLALGASLSQAGSGVAASITGGTTEQIIANVAITARGSGVVVLVPSIALSGTATLGVTSIFLIRYYRNAVLIFQVQQPRTQTGSGTVQMGLDVPPLFDNPGAGPVTYTITCTRTSGSGQYETGNAGVDPGALVVLEFA